MPDVQAGASQVSDEASKRPRPWWHPATLQGAWREGRRVGDAELRGLTASLLRFGVQAGVGAMLALVMLVVLDRQLARQEAALREVAVAMRDAARTQAEATTALGRDLSTNQDHFQDAVISALVGGRPVHPKPAPPLRPVKASR